MKNTQSNLAFFIAKFLAWEKLLSHLKVYNLIFFDLIPLITFKVLSLDPVSTITSSSTELIMELIQSNILSSSLKQIIAPDISVLFFLGIIPCFKRLWTVNKLSFMFANTLIS